MSTTGSSRILLAALVFSFSLLASSQPAGISTLQASSTSETIIVNATDYKFTPHVLNITTGTTVTWVNRGHAAHTSTESSTPPVWSSGNLDPGQNFSYLFTQPGVYSYYCGYHIGAPYYMTGTINVTGQPINSNPPGSQLPLFAFYLIPFGAAGVAVVLVLFWVRRRGISLGASMPPNRTDR